MDGYGIRVKDGFYGVITCCYDFVMGGGFMWVGCLSGSLNLIYNL